MALSVPADVSESVVSVLITALPDSVLSQAATDPAGFQSEIYNSLLAGETPGWYLSLPPDVQSILEGSTYTPPTITSTTSTPTSPTPSFTPTTSTPTTSTPTASRQSNSPTSGAPPRDTSPAQTAQASSGGLSTGAKVGIGVGIPAFALIIGASSAAFYFGKRRGKKKDTAAAQNTGRNTADKVECSHNMPPQHHEPQQYNTPQHNIAPYYNAPQQYAWPGYSEMGTNANVPEMQGSGQYDGMPRYEAADHRY